MELNKLSKLIGLRASGYSYDYISNELSISKTTAIKHCKDLETTNKIRDQRTELLEQILKNDRLLFTDRLKSLGSIANKLREELDKRDFSKLSTEQAVRLYINILKAVQDQQNIISCINHNSDLETYRQKTMNDYILENME